MQLQISGQLVGMEARNGGWMAVGVQEVGAQYPKKLSTKKPELIQQAQSLMGQMVTAAYNEQEGNSINPHTGTPYINRYLEALALGQVQLAQPNPMAAAPAPANVYVAPQTGTSGATFAPTAPAMPVVQGAPMSDAREMKIMRQAGAKVAVALLQHLDPSERNLASLVAISEQLVKYFNEGVSWQVAPVQPSAKTGPGPDEPVDEDGIPF